MGEPIWTNMTIYLPDGWEGLDPTQIEPPPPISLGTLKSGAEVRLTGSRIWAQDETSQLIRAIQAADDAIYQGDYELDPDAIRFHGEANYGIEAGGVREAMDILIGLGVPFEVHDETKYEFQGRMRRFDGKTVDEYDCDNDGAPVMNEQTYRRIRDDVALTPAGVLAKLDDHFTEAKFVPVVPEIPPPS